MWELVKLEIIQESYLKEFYTYENIAFPGLIVLATYIDGSTEYITDPHLVFTQTDVPGTYTCYVYKNKRSSKIYTSFEYKVVEEPKVQARTVNSKINVAKVCAACLDTSASVSFACTDCTTSSSSSCSSTQQQCSSSVSTCTTTYTQCSSTVSQCTTTASACTSTASKCTTTASACTGCDDVTTCNSSLTYCTSESVSIACNDCTASSKIVCTGCDDVTTCGNSASSCPLCTANNDSPGCYDCTTSYDCTTTASKCTGCSDVTECGASVSPCPSCTTSYDCTTTANQCTGCDDVTRCGASVSPCSTCSTNSDCTGCSDVTECGSNADCPTTRYQCGTNYTKYYCWSSYNRGCSCSSYQLCNCTDSGVSQCESCPTSDSIKADVNMEAELEGMLTQVTNIKTAVIKNESKKVGLESYYSNNKGVASSTALSTFSSLSNITLVEGDEIRISYYILSASTDKLNITFLYDDNNIGVYTYSGYQDSWKTVSLVIPEECIGQPISKISIKCAYVKDSSGDAGADQAWLRNPVIHHKVSDDKYRDIYMDQVESTSSYYFEKALYQA